MEKIFTLQLESENALTLHPHFGNIFDLQLESVCVYLAFRVWENMYLVIRV
jgi:hypothetical protein